MSDAEWSGKTLGVIGGGNMAEALLRGVLDSGLIPPRGIGVYDPLPERQKIFSDLGCKVAAGRDDILGGDVLLLAVKPQMASQALEGVANAMPGGKLLVSIVAGVSTASLESLLPAGTRVVRVMPNTPLLVGRGVSAAACGDSANANDMELTLRLFSCAGAAYQVDEKHMDAVTALSGSGPAYLFRFAETLIAGGQALGLDAVLAKELTIGTLRGAAEMLARFEDPATLRERVTSPGGTTAAALAALDAGDFAGLVAAALAAARDRGAELGRQG